MAELTLEIVEGKRAGRQFPLDRALEAGRDPSLPVVLEDERVSRRHARLEPVGAGAIVEDLGSTNGTYVNDQPISGPREVVPGDRVRLGLTVMEIRSHQQVAAQPSALAPVPEITPLGRGVLQPVPEEELQTPQQGVAPPAFAVLETEPAFVPREVLEDDAAKANMNALARLVDSRVKHQTHIAAFALLSLSGLAVLLFFGLR
jgi:FHA domain-containing protein